MDREGGSPTWIARLAPAGRGVRLAVKDCIDLAGLPQRPLTLLTMPANLAGLPALALPVPGGPAGLPASLQLIGPPGCEEQLVALGRRVEAAVAAR